MKNKIRRLLLVDANHYTHHSFLFSNDAHTSITEVVNGREPSVF
jgi:hypothetical protein